MSHWNNTSSYVRMMAISSAGCHFDFHNFNFVCLFLFLQPPQMGSMAMINQPTMMYSQPVVRPANPFGPAPGAQVQVLSILLPSPGAFI